MANVRRSGSFTLGLTVAMTFVGCGGSLPKPEAAVAEYARAAKNGDAATLHAMLSKEEQQRVPRSEIERLVREEKKELSEQGSALATTSLSVETRSRARFGDGEEAALSYERGGFHISSAGSLPGGSPTPVSALGEFRRVLARRSYAGLLRLLTPETRAAMERDLEALVSGLEHPDLLSVETNGDTAEAKLPGGHFVRLKKDAGGAWRIENFD